MEQAEKSNLTSLKTLVQKTHQETMDELKVRCRKCDSTSPRAYINQLLAVVAAAARPTLGLLEETAIRFVSAAQCSIAR